MDSLETQAKNKYDCQKINNMIFCYTQRPLPIFPLSSGRLHQATSGNSCNNQTLGEHPGISCNRGRKDYGTQWCQEHQGETHRINLPKTCLQGLMGPEPPENLHKTDLGPLHIHVLQFCGLVFLCDAWKKEQCFISDSGACSWEHILLLVRLFQP